jgi:simple sugar transport system ATP-binding protein
MARDGASIVVVSEDLDELFEICDTVAVIAGGRLSPARPVAETTVEEVGVWMSGQFDGAGEPAPC